MTSAFQKEMDEKFMESTSSFIQVSKEDLLKGRYNGSYLFSNTYKLTFHLGCSQNMFLLNYDYFRLGLYSVQSPMSKY